MSGNGRVWGNTESVLGGCLLLLQLCTQLVYLLPKYIYGLCLHQCLMSQFLFKFRFQILLHTLNLNLSLCFWLFFFLNCLVLGNVYLCKCSVLY